MSKTNISSYYTKFDTQQDLIVVTKKQSNFTNISDDSAIMMTSWLIILPSIEMNVTTLEANEMKWQFSSVRLARDLRRQNKKRCHWALRGKMCLVLTNKLNILSISSISYSISFQIFFFSINWMASKNC